MLLPANGPTGGPAATDLFTVTRQELIDQFGGLTAYTRSPARGLWTTNEGDVARDEIVILEVIVEELDRDWWDAYRQRLEGRFRQESIVVRSTKIRLL